MLRLCAVRKRNPLKLSAKSEHVENCCFDLFAIMARHPGGATEAEYLGTIAAIEAARDVGVEVHGADLFVSQICRDLRPGVVTEQEQADAAKL